MAMDRPVPKLSSSSRGLAGGFNASILREARRRIRELDNAGKRVKVLTIGRKGRDSLRRDYARLIHDSLTDIGRRRVSFEEARDISGRVLTLFEAGSYAGGHTNTIRVDTEHETHQVDTGFIVMNDRNYPTFTRLLDRLGVARQPSHMSFSVKGEQEDFEYSGTPKGLLCQPRNGKKN